MPINPVAAYAKDPAEILDYVMDWTAWLNGDVISSSSWTLDVGIADAGHFTASTQNVIFISGGTDGQSYNVRNLITTLGGRTAERTFRLNVVSR